MEISGVRSLAHDSGTDDSLLFQQWPVDFSLDDHEFSPEIASSFWEDFDQLSCNTLQPESSQVGDNMPLEQLKTTTWYESISNSPTASSVHNFVMNSSFLDSPTMGLVKPKYEACYSEPIASQSASVHQDYKLNPCQNVVKRTGADTDLDRAREHSLAERKRREKLTQSFIALSTLIPGLKKTDKASLLGDAIEYIKQLQEKVNTLEEQTEKTTMESFVFAVKRYSDGDKSSSVEITKPLPLMEARIFNKDVLISIHCQKRKGILAKIVGEIEKFSLSVVNSSVMTYGDSALNITLVAEKNDELTMSTKEHVKKLRGVFTILM